MAPEIVNYQLEWMGSRLGLCCCLSVYRYIKPLSWNFSSGLLACHKCHKCQPKWQISDLLFCSFLGTPKNVSNRIFSVPSSKSTTPTREESHQQQLLLRPISFHIFYTL